MRPHLLQLKKFDNDNDLIWMNFFLSKLHGLIFSWFNRSENICKPAWACIGFEPWKGDEKGVLYTKNVKIEGFFEIKHPIRIHGASNPFWEKSVSRWAFNLEFKSHATLASSFAKSLFVFIFNFRWIVKLTEPFDGN